MTTPICRDLVTYTNMVSDIRTDLLKAAKAHDRDRVANINLHIMTGTSLFSDAAHQSALQSTEVTQAASDLAVLIKGLRKAHQDAGCAIPNDTNEKRGFARPLGRITPVGFPYQ